jgi:hypothetical protein
MRSPRQRIAAASRLVLALVLLTAGLAGLGHGPAPAGAVVQRVSGYRATVLGWSSWYGSYGLGAEGTAWCIDHGIRAPDPALRYVRTTLTGVPASTQSAMAWAFGRHGTNPDRITAAALMLVSHDLMGAQYPYGRMDVHALTERSIAGFGADGPAVLARARAIRADAVARSGLRGPWQLNITAPRVAPGARGTATVRVTAGGAGVPGIVVTVAASGATVHAPAVVTTGADGAARVSLTTGAGSFRLSASARVPDLALQVFAPTAARAQRVVRPATLDLRAALEQVPPTTTSTTTTSTTTSTTSTTSTTTTVPPTTTTAPPTTTSTTTTAPIPTTSTTSTLPEVPPASVPPPVPTSSTTPRAPTAPPPPALPRTGAAVAPLASTGAGLVLLGASLPRPRRRPGVK